MFVLISILIAWSHTHHYSIIQYILTFPLFLQQTQTHKTKHRFFYHHYADSLHFDNFCNYLCIFKMLLNCSSIHFSKWDYNEGCCFTKSDKSNSPFITWDYSGKQIVPSCHQSLAMGMKVMVTQEKTLFKFKIPHFKSFQTKASHYKKNHKWYNLIPLSDN